MECFEYFLADDRRVIIYCWGSRVWVKIVGEDGGRNLGDFIKEEREVLETEDLNYFTKMFRIFANCEALTVVENPEVEPVEVEKPFELFNQEVNTKQLDNFSLIKREFEKLVKTPVEKEIAFQRFFCGLCNKSFPTKPKFKKHVDSHKYQKPNRYKCDKCPKKFAQLSKFNLHAAVHNKNKKISCNDCEMKFEKNSELLSHTHSVHDEMCIAT